MRPFDQSSSTTYSTVPDVSAGLLTRRAGRPSASPGVNFQSARSS